MSSIFGLVHADAAITPTDLAPMQASMAYWGADHQGIWWEKNAGLGCLVHHNTPESVFEVLPRVTPQGSVITATARLDNRQSLCDLLKIAPADQAITPDSELIHQAYLKWGKDCVQKLVGYWAVAIWHPDSETLWMARDATGHGGLYYTHQNGRFAFASSLKGLLSLPQISRQPNLLEVAHVLTSWPSDGHQTCYEYLSHLPPGQTLTLSPQGLELAQYWDVRDVQPLQLPSSEAYLEAFLEVYTQAVTSQLRSLKPVSATLSGGLDSGSVCALAAREFRETQQNLTVFTHVPLYDTRGFIHPRRFGDESPFVEANRAFIGNLDVHYLKSETASPLAAIRQKLWINDQPSHAAGNFFWMLDLLQTVQTLGFGTLLTGQGGNGTISWGGLPVSWLTHLQEGNWDVLWRKVIQASASPQQTLQRLLPPWSQRQASQKSDTPAWSEYSAINLAWAKSIQLDEQMAATGHDPRFKFSDCISERQSLLRHTICKANTLWQEMGAAFQVEVRDPTLDKRVLEFCLAIPPTEYRHRGTNRALIRRGFAGLLPEQVRLNQTKGLQAADIALRVRDHQAEIAAALTDIESHPLVEQILDIPRMRQILAATNQPMTAQMTTDCGSVLLRGLGCGLFLASF